MLAALRTIAVVWLLAAAAALGAALTVLPHVLVVLHLI